MPHWEELEQLWNYPFEMTFGPSKSRNLHDVISENIIPANQKTELLVFCWLHAQIMFDVTWFPAFVGASDVISSVLSIR